MNEPRTSTDPNAVVPAASASVSAAPARAPRILVVCTGNICRSPLAEQLLRQNLSAAGIDAVVTSAGTQAMTGSAMTPEAAALSLRYGAPQTRHVARQLTEKLIADADLVLTATRDHRRQVVSMLPKATRYTFTLNQFARLVSPAARVDAPASAGPAAQNSSAESVATSTALAPPDSTARPPVDFAAFIADVASTRGLYPSPTPPTLDDVADPYRQSAAVYARAAAAINGSVTTITAALVAAGA
ncbi:low molecular weight phosphatase family protein [Cryobacterium suzukii]|uniref:Low molecular weight phosphatase family protein n=1 Tax=Cryobacterium suzukii TaxID=1259198 RepID=A0A4V3ISR3_9MICO|nr:low molecular weight phosphatase family protein [Cryobacterium suzukii]TFD61502.1 low molecular weight phosphatase family protein [Cryobacterium suzukii]